MTDGTKLAFDLDQLSTSSAQMALFFQVLGTRQEHL
jgi:hypothetical protein